MSNIHMSPDLVQYIVPWIRRENNIYPPKTHTQSNITTPNLHIHKCVNVSEKKNHFTDRYLLHSALHFHKRS
jgi:hypothetical protein